VANKLPWVEGRLLQNVGSSDVPFLSSSGQIHDSANSEAAAVCRGVGDELKQASSRCKPTDGVTPSHSSRRSGRRSTKAAHGPRAVRSCRGADEPPPTTCTAPIRKTKNGVARVVEGRNGIDDGGHAIAHASHPTRLPKDSGDVHGRHEQDRWAASAEGFGASEWTAQGVADSDPTPSPAAREFCRRNKRLARSINRCVSPGRFCLLRGRGTSVTIEDGLLIFFEPKTILTRVRGGAAISPRPEPRRASPSRGAFAPSPSPSPSRSFRSHAGIRRDDVIDSVGPEAANVPHGRAPTRQRACSATKTVAEAQPLAWRHRSTFDAKSQDPGRGRSRHRPRFESRPCSPRDHQLRRQILRAPERRVQSNVHLDSR